MRRRLGWTALLLAALLPAAACSSPRYDWGPYEDSVLAVELDFREQQLMDEIAALEEHIHQLQLRDEVAPPGMHAHVGYLQYLAGDTGAAARHFEAEKALYPQSTVFMDGLLKRI